MIETKFNPIHSLNNFKFKDLELETKVVYEKHQSAASILFMSLLNEKKNKNPDFFRFNEK